MGNTDPENGTIIPLLLPLSLSLSLPLSLACLRWRHYIWPLIFFFMSAQGTHDGGTYDQPGFHLLHIVALPVLCVGSGRKGRQRAQRV